MAEGRRKFTKEFKVAVAITSSPARTSGQSSTAFFVVMMVFPLWYR